MKPTFINNNLEIIADNGEALSVFRQTIYSDRIVVFRTIDNDTLREVHFDKHSGALIDRAGRQATLPKFEYQFDKFQLKGIIEHRFLDELDFKDFKPKGVDIETITVSLFRDDKRVSHSLNLHPVNKFPANYFESVQSCVDRFVADEQAKIKYELFLKDEYSKLTTQEKANFHHGEILFEDRMQGGYPSGFKNPAAAYLSRWFAEPPRRVKQPQPHSPRRTRSCRFP